MKILFLLSRFPYPLEKGDKLRAFQHLNALHAAGHEVHLVALSDVKVRTGDLERISALCQSVQVLRLSKFRIFSNLLFSFFRKLPLQVGYFYSRGHEKYIRKWTRQVKPDLIYCQLIRTAKFADFSAAPAVIDFQDAFSLGTAQRMRQASPWFRPLFARELRLVLRFEKSCLQNFNKAVIISEQDLQAMQLDSSANVAIVPNGVDTSFFSPVKTDPAFDITFIGNLNYPPNIDSAEFLANEVMPLIWKEFPGATLRIGGANPHPRIQALASRKITVTGWVDDIREYYGDTRIFMAPMRIGTGLQNKILEAMSMEIPVITTPISALPIGAPEGVAVLVGPDASQLADHAINLLRDPAKKKEIGAAARTFVIENYSLSRAAKLLNAVMDATASRSR